MAYYMLNCVSTLKLFDERKNEVKEGLLPYMEVVSNLHAINFYLFEHQYCLRVNCKKNNIFIEFIYFIK